MHLRSKAAATLACLALAAAPLSVAAPAQARALDTYEDASDPEGDAVVSGARKADLAEGVYDGADLGRASVENADGDVSMAFTLHDIQGDAGIGSTTLRVDAAVKYLKGYKKTKKGKKPVYRVRKVSIVNVIADPGGDDRVLVNGKECYGTSASITSRSFDEFTVVAPLPCFGRAVIEGSFVFRTEGRDLATRGLVRDTARPAPISLRP